MGKFLSKLPIVVMGIVFALAVASVSIAKPTPKPVKEKGSFVGTFVSIPFSFDGVGQAALVTSLGRDNLGGPFMG